MFNLAQLGPTAQGDAISTIVNIVWLLMFVVFMFFSQRIMVTQAVFKLERDVVELEQLATKARNSVISGVSKKPRAELRTAVGNFMDFFAVPPVDLDPYGIIRKVDLVVKQADLRFKSFVRQVAPNADPVTAANLHSALSGAMTTHQIAKQVRHIFELIKKYKIFQLALILQMQIPLIRRIAVATTRATEAFVAGTPIGDGIGPLVAARLMKGGAKVYAEEEFAVAPAVIAKRKVLVSKASGPGASVGYPGKFMTKLLKTEKIDRIITVDAGMRLEGEKPGSVAEGVGVAMGGVGTERYEIEELAVKNNIPLDAIVIKENEEEAFEGMRMEVLNSVPAALQAIEAAVKRSPVKERILLIGVGNTCGIGNDQKAAAMVAEKVKAYVAKAKAEEAKKKKRFFGLFD